MRSCGVWIRTILERWCDYGATAAFGYGVRVLLNASKVLVMDGVIQDLGATRIKVMIAEYSRINDRNENTPFLQRQRLFA